MHAGIQWSESPCWWRMCPCCLWVVLEAEESKYSLHDSRVSKERTNKISEAEIFPTTTETIGLQVWMLHHHQLHLLPEPLNNVSSSHHINAQCSTQYRIMWTKYCLYFLDYNYLNNKQTSDCMCFVTKVSDREQN